MEEIDFQSQSHDGYDQMTQKKIQRIINHKVSQYIEELYENIVMTLKNPQISMKNLKSLKETDICVNILQKEKHRLKNEYQEILSDYIEQKDDSKIVQNLFIGSNPGLFYSKHSLFDEVSFNRNPQYKLVSIGNLISVEPSEKYIDQKINENSLQISGDTILDITTQQDVVENEIYQKQQQVEENDVKLKQSQQKQQIVKQQSQYHIPQNILSKHSKYCDVILTPVKRKRDFVVPVLTNQNRHNKSRISKQQYFHINDKNLTKFFVTQQKRKYIDKFGNQSQSRIKDNDSQFSKSPFKQESTEKTFHRSNIKKLMKTNKESKTSNPQFKSIHFDKQEQNNFGRLSLTNTKFLIKVLPSEKTKKLFNQSISTFINHNYRPITCRKQFRKIIQNQVTNKQIAPICNQTQNYKSIQNFQSKKLSTAIEKENKLVKQSLSCDDIALKNSFKKMNQNSTKGKKINLSQIQKQNKSLFFRQKNYKPFVSLNKQNEQQITPPTSFQKVCPIEKSRLQTQFESTSDQKQNMSRITTSTKSHQNKYKNLTEIQLEMIKNNNIKRFLKFKKDADSKLSIVTKMGVKITPD